MLTEQEFKDAFFNEGIIISKNVTESIISMCYNYYKLGYRSHQLEYKL